MHFPCSEQDLTTKWDFSMNDLFLSSTNIRYEA